METANNNNSGLVPEWILREQGEAEQEANRRNAQLSKQAVASMTVATKGPYFWNNLIGELDRNARGIERLGLNGRVSSFPANRNTPDNHCRIEVSKPGVIPRVLHQDLFYRSGSDVVRFRAMDGTQSISQLTANDDGTVNIMLDKFEWPVDEKEAACRIFQDARRRIS